MRRHAWPSSMQSRERCCFRREPISNLAGCITWCDCAAKNSIGLTLTHFHRRAAATLINCGRSRNFAPHTTTQPLMSNSNAHTHRFRDSRLLSGARTRLTSDDRNSTCILNTVSFYAFERRASISVNLGETIKTSVSFAPYMKYTSHRPA